MLPDKNRITFAKAEFAVGESQSGVIEVGSAKHIGIIMDTVWDTAAITLLASINGTDFLPLYGDGGTEITIAAAASRAIGLEDYHVSTSPFQYVKLRSGTLALPVVQTGHEATVAITTEATKILTFTSGVGGTPSNDLSILMTVAVNDTLAVTKSGNVIVIKLANATGSKNSAAALQTAIRALSTVGAVDVSAFTVTANTAYTNAPSTGLTAGDPAEVVLDFGDDKALTINSAYAGSVYNGLSFEVDVAVNDTLAVAESGGVITISLANTTGSKNAAAAIETAVQALSVSGIVMTAFTVTGSTEYDAAPPIASTVGTVAELELDFGDSKTLTVTPGFSGDLYHDLSIAVDTAANDTLAVGESEGVITISLADTTPGNNTAAAIQTALRAMDITGYNMLGVTVAESAEYAADRPVTADLDAVAFAGGVDFEIAETAMEDGDESVADESLADGAITTLNLIMKD